MSDDLRPLIKRCLAGEQDAALQLVQRYQARVFGLCFRMLGKRQDAEDMAQETFVRALRSLARWDSQRDFEPWLLAIAGNRCRSLLARRSHQPACQTLAEPVVDATPDLQAAQNLAEEVQMALMHVRPEYRQAFVLFHEHEMSYAEIGVALDCPLGTVKTWVHRARRELIERLTARGVLEESRYAVRKL